MDALLTVSDLTITYGKARAVERVNLMVPPGQVRVILGANGAGKSSLIKAIAGLVKPSTGTIEFAGVRLDKLPPHRVHDLGVSWVPEGREIFATLSVYENLLMGAFNEVDRRRLAQRANALLARFPILRDRSGLAAGSLSGGEQQMLAVARALISQPRLLLMDEPSLGLAPMIVAQVFGIVSEIRDQGMSVLLVEQNATEALRVADWVYVLELGRITYEGPARAAGAMSEQLREAYFGAR